MTLYTQLAADVESMIVSGSLRPGDRLPSVRALRARRAVSQATVLHAYALLESRGLIESRPRSGYFVSRRRAKPADSGAASQDTPTATTVDVSDLVFYILGDTRERRVLPFGSAFPSPLLFPLDRLSTSLARSTRRLDPWATVADLPPGSLALRREIAGRYLALGAEVPVDGIVITNGAMEALNLCLQCLTSPGAIIAIESPTFYGALQAIERLGARAVEIATDPVEGIDPAALRAVLDKHSVSACWFMSNFQNPLGASVPGTRRAQIVQMLAERETPLIEDDVYGELYFGARAQRPFKCFDEAGLVLHCGSFSKTLAPGYRVGWVAAGRYTAQVERLKMMSSLATSIPAQEGLADYLQGGGYERHLRRLRRRLAAQQEEMLAAIARYFPAGTQASRASGGYFTWASLPPAVNALELHRLAALEGIGLSPGPMFSPQRGYENCVRLNFGHPWDSDLRAGIARLGAIACELASRVG
ncbi:MAG: aminotransferase-like domain-containing protein [Panacagrimonas sp.]